jgi:hypothetical protein
VNLGQKSNVIPKVEQHGGSTSGSQLLTTKTSKE